MNEIRARKHNAHFLKKEGSFLTQASFRQHPLLTGRPSYENSPAYESRLVPD